MNKAILVGNLTKDPELSTTPSGVSVCKFSLAVGRKYPNADGTKETDFFNIITWRGLADNCQKYLKKGNKCAVVGQIQNRSYEDKDGNKRYVTEIIADEVEFLQGKEESGAKGEYQAQNEKPKAKKTAELKPIEDPDLPF